MFLCQPVLPAVSSTKSPPVSPPRAESSASASSVQQSWIPTSTLPAPLLIGQVAPIGLIATPTRVRRASSTRHESARTLARMPLELDLRRLLKTPRYQLIAAQAARLHQADLTLKAISPIASASTTTRPRRPSAGSGSGESLYWRGPWPVVLPGSPNGATHPVRAGPVRTTLAWMALFMVHHRRCGAGRRPERTSGLYTGRSPLGRAPSRCEGCAAPTSQALCAGAEACRRGVPWAVEH